MNLLIEDLKKDHGELTEKLNEIRQKGIISNESKKVLFECKELLLEHIRKEDEQLYPVLKKVASNNREVMSLINSYIDNMETISKTVLEFFEKYESSSEGTDFSKDLARLLAILASRIRKEEMILYARFEEMVNEPTPV